MQEKKHLLNPVGLKRPTIFAHRGSSAYAPENTLSAFKLAITQKADGIELDAKLSADGHVVVIHDDTVDRTTDGTGRVKSLSLNELKKLDAGSKFPPLFKPEEIPTLAEVFEAIGRKMLINVELTNYASPTDDLVDRTVSLVKEYHLEEHVIFSSFNMLALIRARYLLPEIPLGLLVFPTTAEMTFRSKLVRFGPMLAFHPFYKDLSPVLIQMAHAANCRINVWTVNQLEIMRQLISDGVDGIFTDDPLLAKKVTDGKD